MARSRKRRLIHLDTHVVGGTPEQFAAFVRAENTKWGQLMKRQNITPD